MEQQTNREDSQSNRNDQGKNQTLQQGSVSSIEDYGRSDEKLEEKQGMSNVGQENSNIRTDKQDTIGNP
jgi:hypothetical protein